MAPHTTSQLALANACRCAWIKGLRSRHCPSLHGRQGTMGSDARRGPRERGLALALEIAGHAQSSGGACHGHGDARCLRTTRSAVPVSGHGPGWAPARELVLPSITKEKKEHSQMNAYENTLWIFASLVALMIVAYRRSHCADRQIALEHYLEAEHDQPCSSDRKHPKNHEMPLRALSAS